MQAFAVKNAKRRSTAVATNGSEESTEKANARLSRCIVGHDPVQYAFKNYEKAHRHLERGVAFQNTNILPGMTCGPWTIDGLLAPQN